MKRHLACIVLAAAAIAVRLHAAAGPEIHATWIGQDGHDYCQAARAPGANDIQDLHLRLDGLEPGEEIDGLLLRRSGGGEWTYKNAGGAWTWKASVIRAAHARSADVFMEPSHSDARFHIDGELRLSGGATRHFQVDCGKSDPNLFMPAAVLKAQWAGWNGHDLTGPDAAVGPDGFEDAAIELTGISTKLELKSIVVESAGGWVGEYGLNPGRHANAELVRDRADASHGTLLFSPR